MNIYLPARRIELNVAQNKQTAHNSFVSARPFPEKFQVAFSFAGEQRDFVRAIAEAVEQELGRATVFFDEWYEYYIAGHSAELRLQEIYGQKCELAVICISERYGGKPWTLAEYDAINARLMQIRSSTDTRDQMRILPIRVSDGDVKGILFNTIVPDFRARPASEAARLIVDRLRHIIPAGKSGASDCHDWPEHALCPIWPIADHSEARTAFERLMTCSSPFHYLPLRGPSEVGKSHITRQMLSNALRMPNIACGRFDFKGTTDMDAEVRSFVQHLSINVPQVGTRLNACLDQILEALKQRAQPTLLIFDTYEAAGETQNWIEKQLLPNLVRAKWLRVVIAGQSVPDRTSTIWEPDAFPTVTLKIPEPTDWFDYSRPHRPDLDLANVKEACRYARNRAAILAQMLGPAT